MRHFFESISRQTGRKGGRVGLLSSLALSALLSAGQPAHALLINPTFDTSITSLPNASTVESLINSAINFYQTTFTDPITVNIHFRDMSTGLGSSSFVFYNQTYSQYRTALGADATSADDATALASLPLGPNNPVNGSPGIAVKSAVGRAIGLNTPETLLNFQGSPCPTFTGSGCIGLNIAQTTTGGGTFSLFAVIEHEIDEILGLGSALNGTQTPTNPDPEDLFRYASAGVRSYAANGSVTNPCAAPSAFFSIDDGVTNLNQFNNCNNGGDYGDWITHTPSQVQDAFTNGTGNPSLTINSAEIRALDVIGFTLARQLLPVPEPATLALLGLGFAGLGFSRRKRAT